MTFNVQKKLNWTKNSIPQAYFHEKDRNFMRGYDDRERRGA